MPAASGTGRCGRHELAAVGDWVAVRPAGGETVGTIEHVLPRRSHFSRKVAGEADRGAGGRGQHRHRLHSHGAGRGLQPPACGAISAPRVREWRPAGGAAQQGRPGRGPVGVRRRDGGDCSGRRRSTQSASSREKGWQKSSAISARAGAAPCLDHPGSESRTLINALVGEARLRTQEVRTSDSRGRHTTRHRQMIVLPEQRGLLIDTPGMRELQLWDVAEAAATPSTTSRRWPPDCHFERLPSPRGAALRGQAGRGRRAAGTGAAGQLREAARRACGPRRLEGCAGAHRREASFAGEWQGAEAVPEGARALIRRRASTSQRRGSWRGASPLATIAADPASNSCWTTRPMS